VSAFSQVPTTRHGFSCSRCSEWFFSTNRDPHRLPCPICGGSLVWRGMVHPDSRVIRDGQAPACDERCTSARGVSCECKCLGVNHGTGRTVTVRAVEGTARVDLDDSLVLERLRAKILPLVEQAAEIDAALVAAITERYGAVWEAYLAGGWLAPAAFAQYRARCDVLSARRKAQSYKLPSRRLAALQALLMDVSAATE